jgi:hypothetical protein
VVARLPRAPEAPLPELSEFLAPFNVHFVQRPSARMLERYVTGLLTEHPDKNCDTLSTVVPGTSEQRLQHLLTDMAWDAGLSPARFQMASLDAFNTFSLTQTFTSTQTTTTPVPTSDDPDD